MTSTPKMQTPEDWKAALSEAVRTNGKLRLETTQAANNEEDEQMQDFRPQHMDSVDPDLGADSDLRSNYNGMQEATPQEDEEKVLRTPEIIEPTVELMHKCR